MSIGERGHNANAILANEKPRHYGGASVNLR